MINNNFIKRHNGPTEADVEKMLKVMERLVKRPHEGGSKNGIGTTAYDGRQAELFYIHIHVDGKIHQYGVNKDTGKAYGK